MMIHIKTKIRTRDDKLYTTICALNVPEDEIGCESFTVICTDFYL